MKLRLGFVTNSSSTNYTILWKGKELKPVVEANLALYEEAIPGITGKIDEVVAFVQSLPGFYFEATDTSVSALTLDRDADFSDVYYDVESELVDFIWEFLSQSGRKPMVNIESHSL